MLRYLFPRIAWADLPPMLVAAAIGALLAGIYGVGHDQVTYSISREYFTKLKFHQFAYADPGVGEREFAGVVGFLATWWVGMIAGWFLARRLIPGQPRARAYRQLAGAFACVLATAVLAGWIGYAYGLWRGPQADYSWWDWAFGEYQIIDRWAFVRVAYIHNASYLGGLAGLIIALLVFRPARRKLTHSGDR